MYALKYFLTYFQAKIFLNNIYKPLIINTKLFIVKTAYPSPAFFIFKALIYTTEFLKTPSYCPITCIPISPCSVDIGNSLEGIVTELDSCNISKQRSCFFVFIIKSLYYLKIFLPENKLKNI